MKVLFLHRHASEKGIGGILEYLHYLPLALKTLGVEVSLYTEGDPKAAPTLRQNGMRCFTGPFVKPKLFGTGRQLAPLLHLCTSEGFDLLHAQGTYRSGYLAQQIHKRNQLPYLVTSHSDIVPVNSQRMQRPKIQKRCQQILKDANFVTHLSPIMGELSHALYDTSAKERLIGNGIDTAEWQPYSQLAEGNYLLGMGRLEREKGFHVLIEAYALLRQNGLTDSLVIAGSGAAGMDLQHQARALGLNVVTHAHSPEQFPPSSVIFTGYLRGELKKRLVGHSKLMLFATQPDLWEEPFGLVQIEAMAAGKALIASTATTTQYLMTQGLQALLVEPSSALSWAEAIGRLLAAPCTRKAQGAANLAHAAAFDWGQIALAYREVYKQSLESAG